MLKHPQLNYYFVTKFILEYYTNFCAVILLLHQFLPVLYICIIILKINTYCIMIILHNYVDYRITTIFASIKYNNYYVSGNQIAKPVITHILSRMQ